jgi:hypothetical protein
VIRRAGFRRLLLRDPALEADVADELWSDPDHLLARGRLLKPGDRCTVVQIDAGRPLLLKRYNMRGPLHTATHTLIRTRARWCWNTGRRACEAGLPLPRPLACVENRIGPLRGRSYLLTEFVPGTTLSTLVERREREGGDLEDLAGQFSGIWQRLGDPRVTHGDLKAANFIVDADGRLWLIDLDSMRFRRTETSFRRKRAADRARFMKNWRSDPVAAAVFRARLDTAGPPAAARPCAAAGFAATTS